MTAPLPTNVRHVLNSKADVGDALAARVLALSKDAILRSGRFTVGISGGSLPATLGEAMRTNVDAFQLSKWHLFYCDERCVPHDDPESNHKLVVDHVVSLAPADSQPTVYPIDTKALGDKGPSGAAEAYQVALLHAFPGSSVDSPPQFDCLLLGMGPDGHTCSLFPSHVLLGETSCLVAAIEDSPKPPPQRITFTYSVLNAALHCLFVATGASKKPALQAIFAPGASGSDSTMLPAGRVTTHPAPVEWFLDMDASPSEGQSDLAASSLL